VEFEEFRVALAKLPSGQHEALLLVGASGFSYEGGCDLRDPVGTTKSRVNRARAQLTELLSIDSADRFGLPGTNVVASRKILSLPAHWYAAHEREAKPRTPTKTSAEITGRSGRHDPQSPQQWLVEKLKLSTFLP
jgi:hypothetical protein